MALAPKQRRELWEEELTYQKAAVQRGELVPAQPVEADFTRVFRFLAVGLQGLPDRLARECGTNAAKAGAIQRAVGGWQEQLARNLMQRHDWCARCARSDSPSWSRDGAQSRSGTSGGARALRVKAPAPLR